MACDTLLEETHHLLDHRLESPNFRAAIAVAQFIPRVENGVDSINHSQKWDCELCLLLCMSDVIKSVWIRSWICDGACTTCVYVYRLNVLGIEQLVKRKERNGHRASYHHFAECLHNAGAIHSDVQCRELGAMQNPSHIPPTLHQSPPHQGTCVYITAFMILTVCCTSIYMQTRLSPWFYVIETHRNI